MRVKYYPNKPRYTADDEFESDLWEMANIHRNI